MVNEFNKSRMSLREGKVYINGVEVMDSISCTINFTPDVSTSRQLGDKTPSSRWIGYAISGSITRFRSNTFIKDVVKEYRRTGRTPEFKIQGLMNDTGSDYFADYGNDLVTAVGVVFTGEMGLTKLDSNGDTVEDTLNFSAYDVL